LGGDVTTSAQNEEEESLAERFKGSWPEPKVFVMRLLFGLLFGGSLVLGAAGLYDAGLLGPAGTFVAITVSTLIANRLSDRDRSWDDLSPTNRFLPLITTLRERAIGQFLMTRPNFNDAVAIAFGAVVTMLETLVRGIVASSGGPADVVTLITLGIVLLPTYTITAHLRLRRESPDDTAYESRLRQSIARIISASFQMPEIESLTLRAVMAGTLRTASVLAVRGLTVLLAPYLFGNTKLVWATGLVVIGVLGFYDTIADMVNKKPELLVRLHGLIRKDAQNEAKLAEYESLVSVQQEAIERLHTRLRSRPTGRAGSRDEEVAK
jgi:hypothetical protein